MKFFLVYRNKELTNIKIEEFNDKMQAFTTMESEEDSWEGEIVLCASENLKQLLTVFGEYRPSNWKALV